jgi:hypothetical protein
VVGPLAGLEILSKSHSASPMVILMESLEVPIIEEKNLADPVGETLGERGQIPFVRTEADTARAATVEMVPIPLAQ